MATKRSLSPNKTVQWPNGKALGYDYPKPGCYREIAGSIPAWIERFDFFLPTRYCIFFAYLNFICFFPFVLSSLLPILYYAVVSPSILLLPFPMRIRLFFVLRTFHEEACNAAKISSSAPWGFANTISVPTPYPPISQSAMAKG